MVFFGYCGNFSNDTYEYVYKVWMKFMPIIETNFSIFCILTILKWNIVMDDWNLDEKIT